MTFKSDREALADPERRDAEAARLLRAFHVDLAQTQAKAMSVLEAEGLRFPDRPTADDGIALLDWDSACLLRAADWVATRRPQRVTYAAALSLLRKANALREVLLWPATSPTLATLKTVAVASAAATFGGGELLFDMVRDGTLKNADAQERLREKQSVGGRKGNTNQSGWHEMAFRLVAAKMVADPELPRKRLLGWAIDRLNESYRREGQRPFTLKALERAMLRSKPLFEALLEEEKLEQASLLR